MTVDRLHATVFFVSTAFGQRLNQKQRLAVALDRIEPSVGLQQHRNRFPYKQMADILSIPIGTVKSRLHTAVARFAKDWKATVGSKELK